MKRKNKKRQAGPIMTDRVDKRLAQEIRLFCELTGCSEEEAALRYNIPITMAKYAVKNGKSFDEPIMPENNKRRN